MSKSGFPLRLRHTPDNPHTICEANGATRPPLTLKPVPRLVYFELGDSPLVYFERCPAALDWHCG